MSSNKCEQLRQIICGPGTGLLVEAHNGLTAKLVEESGFEAIWASGLALSASMGVRDNNELCQSEVMKLLEFMSDATTIPILLDGDTGYGNFNNLRRLVRKLDQIGIAGVCIEDKLFPKTNSFIRGEEQPLAEIEEFVGKIRAGKDVQRDRDFVVVARTEALIAGWSLDAALERATAYAEAGADAVLVHSKSENADQVRAFMGRWSGAAPVVVVPTTYAATPFLEFERMGIGAVIYANHVVRTVIDAVKENLAELYRTRDLAGLDRRIAPVGEVFRLQNVQEMKEAEERYLPQKEDAARAVVLAASRGSHFGHLTDQRPKCMIPVWGKSILDHIVSTLNEGGIKRIACVVGYRPEAVDLPNLEYRRNPDHASSGSVASLWQARDDLEGECVVSYGDVLYESAVLRRLLAAERDLAIVVDTSWCQGMKRERPIDAVVGADAPSPRFGGVRTSTLQAIGPELDRDGAHGEWIGLLKTSAPGSRQLREELDRWREQDPETFATAGLTDLLARMVARGCEIEVVYVMGQWFDVDSLDDLGEMEPPSTATATFRGERGTGPGTRPLAIVDHGAPRG